MAFHDTVPDFIADTPIPVKAWRIAGLRPDPFVTTLGRATVDQLTEFAAIEAETVDGRLFVTRALACRDAALAWVTGTEYADDATASELDADGILDGMER